MTEEDSQEALSMLDERLRRVEFLIRGDTRGDSDSAAAASTNLQRSREAANSTLHTVERTLHSLANKSPAISDILLLHRQHSELFHPTNGPQSVPPGNTSLAQILLAHEQLYKTTTSQLKQLDEIKSIPDSAPLAKLATLQPRISQLQAKQTDLVREFGELRAKTAMALERWYETGVLEMGERWADWEERLKDCEILVRRKEAAKKREEGKA